MTNYSYDNLHRRTEEKWMSGGSAINTFAYVYDVASQLTGASATGTAVAYTYDNLGRLLTTNNTGTTNVPVVDMTNVYDAGSRRVPLLACPAVPLDMEL